MMNGWGQSSPSSVIHTTILIIFPASIQADPKNIASSVLDHRSKARMTMKQVTWIFGFPVHIQVINISTILSSVEDYNAIAWWLKKKTGKWTHFNLKSTLILKNTAHHLNLQWIIITFLLVEGLKYCKSYQYVTPRSEVSKSCWKMAQVDLLHTG